MSAPMVPLHQLAAGDLDDGLRAAIAARLAPRTRRRYTEVWSRWETWANARSTPPLPADARQLAEWLRELAAGGLAPSSLRQAAAAVVAVHRVMGHPSPATYPVPEVLRGLVRAVDRPLRQVRPLRLEQLRPIIASIPADTLRGKRDRALLLLGWAAACRRSELVGLDDRDLVEDLAGLRLQLRQSKTGARTVAVLYGQDPELCPIRAIRRWQQARREAEGEELLGAASSPLFRSIDRHGNVSKRRLTGESVAELVQRYAAELGLDPTDYAGHSLRAGFATSAAAAGAQERDIARVTGHRSTQVLRRYIREADDFSSHPAKGLL